jgi:hypothetical protein
MNKQDQQDQKEQQDQQEKDQQRQGPTQVNRRNRNNTNEQEQQDIDPLEYVHSDLFTLVHRSTHDSYKPSSKLENDAAQVAVRLLLSDRELLKGAFVDA